ncbi:MAG: hypothetical protein ABH950_06305 [Candidatus Altiarchaeota archaeon]
MGREVFVLGLVLIISISGCFGGKPAAQPAPTTSVVTVSTSPPTSTSTSTTLTPDEVTAERVKAVAERMKLDRIEGGAKTDVAIVGEQKTYHFTVVWQNKEFSVVAGVDNESYMTQTLKLKDFETLEKSKNVCAALNNLRKIGAVKTEVTNLNAVHKLSVFQHCIA